MEEVVIEVGGVEGEGGGGAALFGNANETIRAARQRDEAMHCDSDSDSDSDNDNDNDSEKNDVSSAAALDATATLQGGEKEDDEFGDVWAEVESAPPKARKRLKASSRQVRNEAKATIAKLEERQAPAPTPAPAPAPIQAAAVTVEPPKEEEPPPPASPDSPPDPDELDAWEAVNALREAEAAAEAGAAKATGIQAQSERKIITYQAALEALAAPDALEPLLPRVRRFDFRKRGLLRRALYFLCGPPRLPAALEGERDRVFCMALLPFDDARPAHARMLQTLYRSATGADRDCPRTGAHWQDVGFQGADPATDLRGAGMFGLLQALHFCRARCPLALRVYALSRDERQNFPFALVSLNITGMVLQTLREGTLHGECRKAGSVLEAAHELHAALFYEMLLVWRRDFKTIADFAEVKRHLAAAARERPSVVLRALRDANADGLSEERLEFTEIP